MEFLIPGLILVALMAWASTRIKRNAASAFDAETIDTDDFLINKPEGFLHVLNDRSGLAFRAYSKDFGSVGNKDVRQATIEVEVHPGASIDELRQGIESSSEQIESVDQYVDGGEKAAILESKKLDNAGEYYILQKLVTRGDRVFDVRASVLTAHRDDHSGKMKMMLDTVRIK